MAVVVFANTLLHRVWKAKYFPKKELLDADVGYQPSYARRSVWGTLKMVKVGVESGEWNSDKCVDGCVAVRDKRWFHP